MSEPTINEDSCQVISGNHIELPMSPPDEIRGENRLITQACSSLSLYSATYFRIASALFHILISLETMLFEVNLI